MKPSLPPQDYYREQATLSTPHSQILRQYGVPEVMVKLLRSLHDGMEAEVTISSFTSPSFNVTYGLHQGCTIPPTLFLNRVIECWWGRCKAWGVKVFYKYDGKLVGKRTRVLRLLSCYLLVIV